jgi:hypothetical protein
MQQGQSQYLDETCLQCDQERTGHAVERHETQGGGDPQQGPAQHSDRGFDSQPAFEGANDKCDIEVASEDLPVVVHESSIEQL